MNAARSWTRLGILASCLALACGGRDGPTALDDTPASVVVSAPASTLAAGETVQLTAVVKNAAGEAVAARGVAYASSASDVVSVSPSGVAAAVGPVGTATVSATLGALTAEPITLTVGAGPVAQVVKLGTDPATVQTGASFGDSVRVQVADRFGNPKAGVTVTFAVEAGGGTVSPTAATTDAAGKAGAQFTVGTAPGAAQTATATAAGAPAVRFTATAVPRERALTALRYTGSATQPVAVLSNNDNVKFSYWTADGRASGALTQGAYVDARRNIDTRVVYGADELPTRIYDVKSREQIVIVQRENRVDYLMYNASGQYVNGVAVLLLQGKLWTAKILSTPAFAGQLTAVSDRVSFSVTSPAQSGLGPLTEAPAAFSTFFASNVGAAVPSAMQARYSRAALSAAATPTTTQLRKSLTLGGLALIGLGGAPVLFAGSVSVGMVAAGVGIIGIAHLPNLQLDAWDQFDRAFAQFFEDGASLDQSPSETGQSILTNLINAGRNTAKGVSNIASQAGDAVRDAVSPFLDPASFAGATGGPGRGAANVEGYGVDASNTLYPLTGTVTGTGQLSATGNGPGNTNLNITGAVRDTSFTGQYSGTPGNGALTGTTAALGSCQSQTASGGQGTFARAFNMGGSSGNVTFSYEAFNIPDAFQVANGGKVVYTTNGLVSGRASTTFQLSNTSIVFITVTAPRSGTAWNFSLGCPQ